MGGVNGAEHQSTQGTVHEEAVKGTQTSGYGLFSFASDYKMLANDVGNASTSTNGDMLDGTSSTLAPARYLMLGHNDGSSALVHVFQKLAEIDLCWTKNNSAEIDLGGIGADAKLVFYYVNGGVRIADAEGNRSNTMKWHGVITPKVYGYPQLPEDDSETTYNYYDGYYAMRREASVYRTSEYGVTDIATGSVTFSGAGATNGDTITIESTEQVTRVYEAESDNIGGASPTSGAIIDNGNVAFLLSGDPNTQADYFMAAVNHANGHFGQIIATDGGTGIVTLTQATAGRHGSNTITHTDAGGTIAVSGFSSVTATEDSVGATNARWVTVDAEIKPCFEEVENGDGDMCALNAIMKTDAESLGYWYSYPSYSNTTFTYTHEYDASNLYDRIADSAGNFLDPAYAGWIYGTSIRITGFTHPGNNASKAVITAITADYIQFATTGNGQNEAAGDSVKIRGWGDVGAQTGGAAFANEKSALGKTHNTYTSDDTENVYRDNVLSRQTVRSNMRWGMQLGYREGSKGSGTWMPNTGVRYKFFVTTMYDDGTQESLPQLLARYTSWDVAPDHTSTQIQYQNDAGGAGVDRVTFTNYEAGWQQRHGFNVGQRIDISGFANSVNNQNNVLISAITNEYIQFTGGGTDEGDGLSINVKLNNEFIMDKLDWQNPPSKIADEEFFINFGSKTAKSEVRLSNYQALRSNGTNNRMWFSPVFKINGAQAGDIDGDAQPDFSNKFVFGNGDASSTAYGNPRISGTRIYWASNEDGYSTLWEIMHCDFNKGVKALGIDGAGGESGWAPWKQHSVFPASDGSALAEEDSQNPGHYLSVDFGGAGENRWLHPPRYRTYFENNFHEHDDTITVDSYKTAVVANNRTYIGNIQQTIDGTIETYPDRILKSPRGQYDKFPSKSFIDTATNDGDEIVHITTYADRLLQFGKNTMYIINISGDTEFLEDTHRFKGILSPAGVCTTDEGVAWVNKRGVYFYDGKQVANLLEKGGTQVIDDATWNAFCIDPAIGFIPRKKELIVVDSVSNTGEGEIFHYSFITKAWVKGGSAAWELLDDDSKTNMIVDYDGELIYFDYGGDKMEVWRDTPDDDAGKAANLVTKDFDFGDPAIRKKIYKVYISYKGDGTHVEVHYGVNGISPASTFMPIKTDGSGDSSGTGNAAKCIAYNAGTTDWLRAELKPVAAINDIYSFRLRVGSDYTNKISDDFEINDITIVYRKKPVK